MKYGDQAAFNADRCPADQMASAILARRPFRIVPLTFRNEGSACDLRVNAECWLVNLVLARRVKGSVLRLPDADDVVPSRCVDLCLHAFKLRRPAARVCLGKSTRSRCRGGVVGSARWVREPKAMAFRTLVPSVIKADWFCPRYRSALTGDKALALQP